MSHDKTREILRSIAAATLGAAPHDDALGVPVTHGTAWSHELSHAIGTELGVVLTPAEVEGCDSLFLLTTMVASRLPTGPDGKSIVHVYATLELIAREELHPEIHYHWHARWSDFSGYGNFLTAPDGLDYVELVLRMEEEFGFGIPNEDAAALITVGQTVRYLWERSRAQTIILRPQPAGVCRGAFIFHELRRVLMVRGGVPRHAVRPAARLGALLPSFHVEFWKQVQDIFQVDLPRGSLLALGRRIEKRTTVKELVNLIISSQNRRDAAPAPGGT